MHDAHRHVLVAQPPHRFLPRDAAARVCGQGPTMLLREFLPEGPGGCGLANDCCSLNVAGSRCLLLIGAVCVVH